MNFFTESFDLPQKEQRRCFSLGMARRLTNGEVMTFEHQRPKAPA
jgi:hypothetical protein